MTTASNVSAPVRNGVYPTPPGRGMTSEELDDVTAIAANVIREKVDRLTRDDWEQGMRWYHDANKYVRLIAEHFGHDWRALAWVIALLSPQNRWDQNREDLVDLLVTGDCGALPLGKDRARIVIEGGSDGPTIAGGWKVRSFARNIEYPNNSLDVTIDSHMANVLQVPNEKYLQRKGVYFALAEAFRIVAAEHAVFPHQLQAALWINTRGAAE